MQDFKLIHTEMSTLTQTCVVSAVEKQRSDHNPINYCLNSKMCYLLRTKRYSQGFISIWRKKLSR